ncbi:sulfurtransferase TusA family protein [Candidatus Lokiarchaeum ossiferum]|uniref:sulfurtransferase TusA family protein n=1 Tax=Candidatus Lokiarchaeum ossiferum TaxID=2951803 RepID=UPI00352FB1A0
MKIDHILNVNGKVCPMPAALTRKMLKQMNSHEIIEIVGDFDPALENVVNMITKNNGKVLEQEKKTNYFRVVAQMQ